MLGCGSHSHRWEQTSELVSQKALNCFPMARKALILSVGQRTSEETFLGRVAMH